MILKKSLLRFVTVCCCAVPGLTGTAAPIEKPGTSNLNKLSSFNTNGKEETIMHTITTQSLLKELYDLPLLAEYPEPYFISRQFSSYDRHSVAPDAPGWFANGDCANTETHKWYLRDEKRNRRIERVIAETDKPGAIIRCWSANVNGVRNSTIRIYLDGSKTPVVEENAEKFFLGEGLLPPSFSITCSGHARNMHFPIPFARGCKITIDGDWYLYYHIGIREYDRDIKVQTFTPNDLITWKRDITKTAKKLASYGSLVTHAATNPSFTCSLKHDEEKDALTLKGPAAITVLTLKATAADRERALRGTIMQVFFDDSPIPQIESPVGDFFGTGPGICPYASLPFTVTETGTMQCRYVMPFRQTARIRFKNFSGQKVTINGTLTRKRYTWTDRSMHLRAKWCVEHDVEGRSSGYDMNYLDVHGKGVWVGTALMIMNPTPFSETYGGWWGEGDEKIYIDGESFPSTFGTGSEDYFGYAWSSPDLFHTAYYATTRCDGPGNRGFTANSRWHFIDRLPFTKSIEFYMELQTHNSTKNISYGRIGYCYTIPGARDNHGELTPLAVTLRYPGSYKIEGWDRRPLVGFRAAEKLNVTQGVVCEEQDTIWTNGTQIMWKAKKGETLVIDVPCPGDPNHQVFVAALTTCPGGGQITMEYAGAEYREPVSLRHPVFTMVRQYDIRRGEDMPKLKRKTYQLKLTCIKSGKVGLDYIKFN